VRFRHAGSGEEAPKNVQIFRLFPFIRASVDRHPSHPTSVFSVIFEPHCKHLAGTSKIIRARI
jgi:hypothetical protein